MSKNDAKAKMDVATGEQRYEKLQNLINQGVDPYVNNFHRNYTNQALIDEFSSLENDELEKITTTIVIAGRLVSKRGHGKAFFGHLLDENAQVQIYANIDLLGEPLLRSLQGMDVGDWLGVEGKPFRTRRGEFTLQLSSFTLLSKSLLPLPEKYHGLQDKELRYRYRYLDLASNMEVRTLFKKRSMIISSIRRFLEDYCFMEVETPVLQSIYGGAAARPFSTHHNELKQNLFLRIALELYLKRLIVGGFEKVFEIGRVFRNEGISYKHNPEYTLLELYQAYADYEDMMDLTEALIRAVVQYSCSSLTVTYQGQTLDFSKPFKRLKMVDAIQQFADIDVFDEQALKTKYGALGLPEGASRGQMIAEIYDACVESELKEPTFIIDYPWETSPLAKKKKDDERFVERFELIVCGMELANAFSELNDPIDQEARFKDQLKAKEQGWEDAHEMDEDFIKALKHGMPPTGGLGIGIDRLVMLLCDAKSIRDVLFFPHMRPREQA